MAYSTELCKLIIQNMKVIEAAPKIVTQIEKKIFKEIDQRCENYFKKNKGWLGTFDFIDDDLQFYPDNWSQGVDTQIAKFAFDLIGDDPEESHWVSVLLDLIPEGNTGFKFSIDHGVLKVGKPQFRKLLQKYFSKNTKLQELGFRNDKSEPELVLAVTLDEKSLVAGYPTDLDRFFKPIDNALDAINEAQPFLNKIVNDIREEAGLK